VVEPAPRRWTAQELLDLVLDEGSFVSWDEPGDISDAPPDYRAELDLRRAIGPNPGAGSRWGPTLAV
jgi:hypothetical protein